MFDNNQKIPMISTFFGQGQTTHGLLKKLFFSRPCTTEAEVVV